MVNRGERERVDGLWEKKAEWKLKSQRRGRDKQREAADDPIPIRARFPRGSFYETITRGVRNTGKLGSRRTTIFTT